MPRLLITGGGGAGVEALYRLWKDRYEVHFADAVLDAIPAVVPPSARHQIPIAGAEWPSALADLCDELDVDVLIPTVDEELSLIPRLAMQRPGLRVLLPQPEFVTLMKDKLLSMQRLALLGIDVPRTCAVGEAQAVGFPCLIKPRDGRGSRGVAVVATADQVDAYMALSERGAQAVVAQELMRGQEWTIYLSSDRDGRLCSVIPMRVDLKRGVTIRAETVRHEAIIEYCRVIHERCRPHGPFNVQLMETTDGRLAAFEINPRVSTTLCLAVAAGADPVADAATTWLERGLQPFIAGVRLRRTWHNHFEKPM